MATEPLKPCRCGCVGASRKETDDSCEIHCWECPASVTEKTKAEAEETWNGRPAASHAPMEGGGDISNLLGEAIEVLKQPFRRLTRYNGGNPVHSLELPEKAVKDLVSKLEVARIVEQARPLIAASSTGAQAEAGAQIPECDHGNPVNCCDECESHDAPVPARPEVEGETPECDALRGLIEDGLIRGGSTHDESIDWEEKARSLERRLRSPSAAWEPLLLELDAAWDSVNQIENDNCDVRVQAARWDRLDKARLKIRHLKPAPALPQGIVTKEKP